MPDGLWLLIAFVAVVVIYTVATIRRLMKQSDEQWKQVDKDKLKKWEDDEDW